MGGILDSIEQSYPGLLGKLAQTWPSRAAQGLLGAATLPGDVYTGRVPVTGPDGYTNPEVINRSADLAGLMVGSPVAPEGAVGSGARALPTNNYLKSLTEYTKTLYREMSPENAIASLPGSNTSVGYGAMGTPRQFYADTPELALGQGANRGVRVQYDAGAFEGQINKKPGWEPVFQSGSAEYLAQPKVGSDVRQAVQGFTVDKSALANAPRYVGAQFNILSNKLKSAGWSVNDANGVLTFSKPTK